MMIITPIKHQSKEEAIRFIAASLLRGDTVTFPPCNYTLHDDVLTKFNGRELATILAAIEQPVAARHAAGNRLRDAARKVAEQLYEQHEEEIEEEK